MQLLEVYHHFKKQLIKHDDRISKCERYVVDLLLGSNLPDSERDSSICWELKHQASVLQFARIMAQKRDLPIDVCAIGMLFHDIYSIVHGKYKDHAHLSTQMAIDILSEIDGFSAEELDQISRIIYNHSDKHIWTDDPFQEFGKDVDVLDCFLYEGAFIFYLGNKPLAVFKEYLIRAKKVWDELGIPQDPRFNLLDGYCYPWFQNIQTTSWNTMSKILAILIELSNFDKNLNINIYPPPFCIVVENGNCSLYANQPTWLDYVDTFPRKAESILKEKHRSILNTILLDILEKESSMEVINDDYSPLKQDFISDNTHEITSYIVESSNQTSTSVIRAFVFWPLVEIFESLDGQNMLTRLKEFGVELDKKNEEVQQ